MPPHRQATAAKAQPARTKGLERRRRRSSDDFDDVAFLDVGKNVGTSMGVIKTDGLEVGSKVGAGVGIIVGGRVY